MNLNNQSKKGTSLKSNMSFLLGILFSATTIVSCEKTEVDPTDNTKIATEVSNPLEVIGTQTAATGTTSSALDLRVDFGTTSIPINFNNGSLTVSAPTALKDFNSGALTQVKLATVAAFQGSFTNSQIYPSTLGIPQTAAEDAVYGTGTTSVLTLTGLDPSLNYTLSFFASRMGQGSTASLETQYKVIGASTQTVLL